MAGWFFYHWYFDKSHPIAGMGWCDQTIYFKVAQKLAKKESIPANIFSYQIGYPLLGALFYFLFPQNPFMPVSLLLLLASLAFLYFGAKSAFSSPIFIILFLFLLFWGDGAARTLNYPIEIFAVSWNNQVLFFCFSFFFWLFWSRKKINLKLLFLTGLITGLTISSREESVLFILPLLAIASKQYRIKGKNLLFLILISLLFYLPQPIMKTKIAGSIFSTGRLSDQNISYIRKLLTYTNKERLANNLIDVVYNSSARNLDFGKIGVKAILQTNPWLWLSLPGLALFFFKNKKSTIAKKFFILSSFFLLYFYLAGENMNIYKLKYCCIRYITPAFISLNFGVVFLISNICCCIDLKLKKWQKNKNF